MSNTRIIKDSSIYLLGELLSKGLPFFMLPYLTRKLGTEGFGMLSYYTVWIGLASVFLSLSQEGAITRYYYFYGKRSLGMVVKAGGAYSVVLSIICLLIAFALRSDIFIYLVLLSLFQVFVNVQLSLRQCQKQPLSYILIQIILSLSNVVFTYLFLEYLAKSDTLVDYRILAILFANILTFTIVQVFLGKSLDLKLSMTKKKWALGISYIFTFGFPLVFHQLSFFVKGQVDRLFIYNQYSMTELGVYSAGVQLAAILPVTLMAVNKAIVPHFYQRMKVSGDTVSKDLQRYCVWGLVLCGVPAICAFLLPSKLYIFFLGIGYEEAKYFVVFYLLGYGLTMPYLILVNYLFYKGLNKEIALGSSLSIIVYLVFLVLAGMKSIYFIPMALFFSNLFLIVYLIICVKRELN